MDGLDLSEDRGQDPARGADRPTDTFTAWLESVAHGAPRAAGNAGDARGVLADAASSLASAFNAAIQVWQDFDDTAPLRPAGGGGECIDDWLGPVRRERLLAISQRVQAAAAQMRVSLGNGPDAGNGPDVADAVGFDIAQMQLRAGASPPDAARVAIALLTARLVQARTLANGIKDAPTLT